MRFVTIRFAASAFAPECHFVVPIGSVGYTSVAKRSGPTTLQKGSRPERVGVNAESSNERYM